MHFWLGAVVRYRTDVDLAAARQFGESAAQPTTNVGCQPPIIITRSGMRQQTQRDQADHRQHQPGRNRNSQRSPTRQRSGSASRIAVQAAEARPTSPGGSSAVADGLQPAICVASGRPEAAAGVSPSTSVNAPPRLNDGRHDRRGERGLREFAQQVAVRAWASMLQRQDKGRAPLRLTLHFAGSPAQPRLRRGELSAIALEFERGIRQHEP